MHHVIVSKKICGAEGAVVSFPGKKGPLKGVSERGGSHVSWGPQALVSGGGTFQLCWCSGLRPGQVCEHESDFSWHLGTMRVRGPLDSQHFSCVRGQVCHMILRGVGFGVSDRVALLSSCARSGMPASFEPIHSVQYSEQVNESLLRLSFGTDPVTGEAGHYNVCWCSGKGGSENCKPDQFLTTGGTLQVEGPFKGQEAVCALGQDCLIQQLGGVSLQPGDRVTAQTFCGDPTFLSGLPGSGIASTDDGSNFRFVAQGSDDKLRSAPGIYRLCWCRPGPNLSCADGADFIADVGLFISTGPAAGQTFNCTLGQHCNFTLQGISLAKGDKLRAMQNCHREQPLSYSSQPFSRPLATLDGETYHAGLLTIEELPQSFHLCWCPASLTADGCSKPGHFIALAAALSIECPPTFFQSVHSDLCKPCPVGSYCPGYQRAPIFRCPTYSTTTEGAMSSKEACKCRPGYHYDEQTGFCKACPEGSFKEETSNSKNCPGHCPNAMTSALGAARVEDCFCRDGFIDEDPQPYHISCVPDSRVTKSSDNSSFHDPEPVVYLEHVSIKAEAREGPSCEHLQSEVKQSLTLLMGLDSSFDRLFNFTCSRYGVASERARILQQNEYFEYGFSISTARQDRSLELASLLQNGTFETLLQGVDSASPLQGSQLLEFTAFVPTTISCPPRLSFIPGVRALSEEDCQCNQGYEPNEVGKLGLLVDCRPCALGTFKADVGDTSCTSCGDSIGVPGSPVSELVTLQRGQTDHSSCECGPGLLTKTAGQSVFCKPCPQGFICSGGNSQVPCPNGTTSQEGAASHVDCECQAGFTASPGRVACEPCTPGRAKEHQGQEPCSPCQAGRVAGAGLQKCLECQPGRVPDESKSQCARCPAGRQQEKPGQSTCPTCEPGTIPNEDRTGCLKCPTGKYSIDGREACETCSRFLILASNTCHWIHLPAIVLGFVMLVGCAFIVRRRRITAFQQRLLLKLKTLQEQRAWSELWSLNAHAVRILGTRAEVIYDEVKQESVALGIGFGFVMDKFQVYVGKLVESAEWRVSIYGPAVLGSFIEIHGGSQENPPAQWLEAEASAAPQDPNFKQMAPLFSYGEHAPGFGMTCPRDGMPNCSIVDAVILEGDSGPADQFVSWVWTYQLSVMTGALSSWMRNKDVAWAKKQKIWWCYFCNNQFRMLLEKASKSTAELIDTFGNNVGRVGRMWMVFDGLTDSQYIGRIWCIFEAYVCCKQDIPCSILAPGSQGAHGSTSLRVHELVDACKVYAQNAKASVKEDEDGIKHFIEKDIGFEAVNEAVERQLRLVMLDAWTMTFAGAVSSREQMSSLASSTSLRQNTEEGTHMSGDDLLPTAISAGAASGTEQMSSHAASTSLSQKAEEAFLCI
eukprot:TRINITY_DN5777_c0_g1_i4.p1 TRINITY_DN5777_c0_g1~~TRINITY_DN5777_c0_g1_i4.p1  ORF type:complete len:1558 (-),score=201.81 TRINITY_DN5777_c0_g1_i4:84-4205(-)